MAHPTRSIVTSTLLACTLVGLSACQTPSAAPPARQRPPLMAANVSPRSEYQALVHRQYGTVSRDLEAIETQIAHTPPAQYQPIELQLLWVLENPESTAPAKIFACQMLRIVGSEVCVPEVGELLIDPELSHAARNVLLAIPGAGSAATLQNALIYTNGVTRVGIINTLGDRKYAQAIPALAALFNTDDDTRLAVYNALGKIGGNAGADVLAGAKVPPPLRDAWTLAMLRCASSLEASNDMPRASGIYHEIFAGTYSPAVRSAALVGVARADREKSVPILVASLLSDDPLLHKAAGSAIAGVASHEMTAALAQSLAGQTAEGKLTLLTALSARGDSAGLTGPINTLAADDDANVRLAAVVALARLGDASSVPVLAASLKTPGPLATAARQTLIDLDDAGVTDALLKQIRTADPAVRAAVIAALTERRLPELLLVARQAASDADADVRTSAFRAIGTLGSTEDFSLLLARLAGESNPTNCDSIVEAMGDIARRNEKGPLTESVIKAVAGSKPQTRVYLLGVLSVLGGEKAFEIIRDSLAVDDADVHKTAVRILGNWPDPSPIAELLAVAKSDPDASTQIIALQGYIRMAGQQTGMEKKIAAYRMAASLVKRPDEIRRLLSGIAGLASPDALRIAEPYLTNRDVENEAFSAYERIAMSISKSDPALAKEALKQVSKDSPDPKLRARALQAADAIKVN